MTCNESHTSSQCVVPSKRSTSIEIQQVSFDVNRKSPTSKITSMLLNFSSRSLAAESNDALAWWVQSQSYRQEWQGLSGIDVMWCECHDSSDTHWRRGEIVGVALISEVHYGPHDDIKTIPLLSHLDDLESRFIESQIFLQSVNVSDSRSCIHEQIFRLLHQCRGTSAGHCNGLPSLMRCCFGKTFWRKYFQMPSFTL